MATAINSLPITQANDGLLDDDRPVIAEHNL
jgi:hypothetical protein